VFQIEIILDNAVVNHDEAASAIAMGVRVFLRGASMRGPAGVANAEGSIERVLTENLFEVNELTGRAAELKSVARRAANGDARRVVSAIFESPQPLDDDRNYLFRSHVTDNSAHISILRDGVRRRETAHRRSVSRFPCFWNAGPKTQGFTTTRLLFALRCLLSHVLA